MRKSPGAGSCVWRDTADRRTLTDGSGGGFLAVMSQLRGDYKSVWNSLSGSKEDAYLVVSGYTDIEVADLDEALRMVRTWPGCPIVEIRPLEA